MKNYLVTVPFAGHVVLSVEAENEENAEALALEKCAEISMTLQWGFQGDDLQEDYGYDFYEALVEGNIARVRNYTISAKLQEDEDDD